MGEQRDGAAKTKETFNALAESKDWYCKQCQKSITYESRESYYLTGYCPPCAQVICNNE